MTEPVGRFREVIERRLGLQLMPRFDGLGPVLARRSAALAMTEDKYLDTLECAPLSGELGALAEELTVCETYMYRNAAQLEALAEVALPALAAGPRRGQMIRILSAGCASGDEPYSIAMAAAEVADRIPAIVGIRAVDANRAMLARAREGRFRAWALRETPADIQHRYFQAAGPDLVLNAAVRRAVSFEHRNLLSDDPELWAPGSYDVVFCRNVIMYFSAEAQRATIERIAGALAPGGFLFLGYAETLRGLSHRFGLCHSHGAFYYCNGEAPRVAAALEGEPAPLAASSVVGATKGWVDAIRHAVDRIAALSAPAQQPAGAAEFAPGETPGDDRDEVLALVQRERFDEALAIIERQPPVVASQPDRVLLYAVLLAHRGQLAAAEAACRELLVFERQVAGAHHVLALCRDAAGDHSGADAHRYTAAYLDPTFAMPHLHLGLAARRTGDHAAARRELGQALALLHGESASRLLLFGGGFDRDALIALCRAELAACGGAP